MLQARNISAVIQLKAFINIIFPIQNVKALVPTLATNAKIYYAIYVHRSQSSIELDVIMLTENSETEHSHCANIRHIGWI